MPPSGSSGSDGSGSIAQRMRELADQMRQVQDTVAALAEDNATLKAKVAVLEASVERLQRRGRAAGQKQGPTPGPARHRPPPEASGTGAAAAPPRGHSLASMGSQTANNSRTPRGQRGRGERGSRAGEATATQTLLFGGASGSATHTTTSLLCATGDANDDMALPPRDGAGSTANQASTQAPAAARLVPRRPCSNSSTTITTMAMTAKNGAALRARRPAAPAVVADNPAVDPATHGGCASVQPLPFAEALALAHTLRLVDRTEWGLWCKNGHRPASLPMDPAQVRNVS